MKRLLALLTALQLADVATTWLSLHHGGIEANPLVGGAYLSRGWQGWVVWILVKLILVAAVAAVAELRPRVGRDAGLVVVGITLATVALNLMVAL